MKSFSHQCSRLVLFLMVSLLFTGAGQRKNSSVITDPAAYLTQANNFFDLGAYDSALSKYLKGEAVLEKQSAWKELAFCKNSIAEVYRILNENDRSVLYSEAVLTICRDHIKGNSEALAKAYEVQGKVQDYNVRDFEKAESLYTRALEIRRALYGKEHPAIAENIYLIGRTYLNRGKFVEAGKHFDDAVAMKVKLDGEDNISLYDVYMSYAVLNRRQLKMQATLNYYQKAQELWRKNKRPENHPNYALLLYGMGNLYIESGMYEDAIQQYTQAVKLFEHFYGEKDFRVATTYANIGACYSNQLQFVSAVQYHTKALSIYEQILEKDHPFISNLYIEFLDVYKRQGRFEEAGHYGQKAIDALESRYPKKDSRELGIAYLYHASALHRLNKEKEALSVVDNSIGILGSLGEKYLLCNAYTTRAQIHEMLGNFTLAEADFTKALGSYEDLGNRNINLAFTYAAFGEYCNRQKQFSKARELSDKGLYHLSVSIDKSGKLQSLNNFLTTDFLTSLLPVRGESLLRTYDATHDQKELQMALENYTFLTHVFEKVIKESKAERSKLLQLPNLAVYYEKAVDCALKLYQVTNDQQFKHKAFAFAEQSKAIILWQYVHDTQAREFANIPQRITAEERRLKEKIGFLEKSLMAENIEPADSSVKALQKEHFTLKLRYDSLLNDLEKNYPAYHALKYKRADINTAELMGSLQDGEGIVEYLVGDDNIYAFLVTAQTIDILTFSKASGAEKYTSGIREGLMTRDQKGFSKNAYAFYQELFQPLEATLKKQSITDITIIPDGFISYVPMEALVKDVSAEGDPSYLLYDYTFHYQFSAGLIQEYRNVKKTGSSQSFVGFAPSFDSAQPVAAAETLSSLAFTQDEVDHITSLFKGKSLIGGDATESSFKNVVQQYNIIHLATHAVLDDRDADLSRLHFSPKDSLEDGKLYAYELFNMQIPASLVTLSACNTGVGQLHKGEGVMSLSRAFAYAGCPSIVTSLWQAQDRSTATLMKFFYENLAEGKDKAEALREAKIRYLKEADKIKGLPFFWAGFILVGDESALETNDRTTYAIAALLFASLLGFGLIVRRRFYSRRSNSVA